MKKILPLSIFMLSSGVASAQFSFGTNTPSPVAIVDIASTSKGFLIPRMDAAQRTSIPSPPEGLMVYQTDGAKGLYTYSSGTWTQTSSVAGNGLTNNTTTGKVDLGGTLTLPATITTSTAAGGDLNLARGAGSNINITNLTTGGTRLVTQDASGALHYGTIDASLQNVAGVFGINPGNTNTFTVNQNFNGGATLPANATQGNNLISAINTGTVNTLLANRIANGLTDAQVDNAITVSGVGSSVSNSTITNSPITGSSISGSTGSFTTITGTALPNTSSSNNIVVSNGGALETRTVSSLDGNVAVVTGASLTGNGKTGNALNLNTANPNTFTATQTLQLTAAQGDNLIGSVNAGTTNINDARVADNLTISGGTVNNTPVGFTTRSTGAFTDLTANGATTLTGATTDISSATTTLSGTTTTIGGAGMTTNLNAPTIHVPALSSGIAVTVVGLDASNNLVKTNAATSASNGLTMTGNNVELGGTLTHNTTITADPNTALNLAGANDGLLAGDALYNVENITTGDAPAYQMGIASSAEYNGTGVFIDATTSAPGIGVVTGASNEARTTNTTYQAIGADNLASVDPGTVTGNFPHAIGASGIGVANGAIPTTGSGAQAIVLGLSGGTGFNAGTGGGTSNWNGIGTEGYLDYNRGTTGRVAGGYFNGNNYNSTGTALIGTSFGVIGSIGDNPSSSYQALFNAPSGMHAAIAAVNSTASPSATDLALYTSGNSSFNGSTSFNGSQSVRTRIVNSTGDAVTATDYFLILGSGTGSTFNLSTPAVAGLGRELIIKNNSGGAVTSTVGFIPSAGGSAIFSIPVGTIHLINDGTNWQQVD